jgi:putative flippase GtrA/glycosyltransferase involved in cell wall biosynthesis
VADSGLVGSVVDASRAVPVTSRHRRHLLVGRLALSRIAGFGAVGLGVFVGGEALLYGLVHFLHFSPNLAYLIQAITSIEVSFVLNRWLNWGDRGGRLGSQLVSFHLTKAITVPVNQILFASLLGLGVHYLLAMLMCTALITVVNFVANDRLVFARPVPAVGVSEPFHLRPDEGPGRFIGVVIPVRNSQRTIGRCVTSVLNQEYQNLRIYIVGNTSDVEETWNGLDGVRDDPRVRCLEWSRPHGWHGRDGNAKRGLGVQTAIADGADVVAFLDSQVEAPQSWLTTALGLLDSEKVDGVGGVSRRSPDDTSLTALYQDGSRFSEWPRFGGASRIDRDNAGSVAQLPITANFAVRSSTLRKILTTWPAECPHGWEDFHLDWALLESGASLLCTNVLVVYRLHQSKFRLAKHVTSGMAAVSFYRSFPDSGFVRRRFVQAALAAVTALVISSILLVVMLYGSLSLLIAVAASMLLSLLFLGTRSVDVTGDWRTICFPVLDAVHVCMWVSGVGIALIRIPTLEMTISRALLTRR